VEIRVHSCRQISDIKVVSAELIKHYTTKAYGGVDI
jgi:hypothetical protein